MGSILPSARPESTLSMEKGRTGELESRSAGNRRWVQRRGENSERNA